MMRCLLSMLLLARLAASANIPRPSPELAVKLVDGQELLLSQYRGKVVALEFLLTTCPHCQRCSQIMEKLQQSYGKRGFQSIGVGINVDPANPKRSQQDVTAEYAKVLKLTYPVAYCSQDMAMNFLQHPIMLRLLMPQLVFIDRQGVIVAQFAGNDQFFDEAKEEANFRAMLEKLLPEPPVKKSRPAARKKAP